MPGFLETLFDAAAFVPHGYCLLWRPDLVALHAVSDGLIALAYFSIPLALIVFVRRRGDLQYGWMFGLFAAFITACGTTHLAGLVTLWEPYYGLQGMIKVVTAGLSLATATIIWPVIPKALALPSPAQLRLVNAELTREVGERSAAQRELQRAYATIEERVEARTRELAELNERLRREVEERRRAEQQHAMLLAELRHRVRNTLTVVKSIATQTSRHSGSLADFEEKFEARIQALADVHNLLIESNWASTGLRQLIEHQLRPYAELDGVRFRTEGPELQVRPRPAVTLGLVVHELATNAAKYGALSRPGGRLEVRWRVAEEETVPALEIVWTEAGGPPVAPPERVGFGSELITFSMRYEFDGNAELAYRPEGLQCTLRMPLPSGAPIEL